MLGKRVCTCPDEKKLAFPSSQIDTVCDEILIYFRGDIPAISISRTLGAGVQKQTLDTDDFRYEVFCSSHQDSVIDMLDFMSFKNLPVKFLICKILGNERIW